jgi:hypothetical protein
MYFGSLIQKWIMMKHILLPLFLLCSLFVFSQDKEADVKKLIFEKDSLFWVAYNNCNVEAMGSVLTDDVEFYHDKGGATIGRDTMMKVIKMNLCSNDSFRLRRAPVKGTVNVYVMNKNNVPYGAIISGQHVFYVNQKGKQEFLDGLARFAQLWLLKDGEWKMSRILSYDHGPAPQNIIREEKPVTAAVLNKHAGKYKGSLSIEVLNDNGVLKLNADGKEYLLHPASDDVYFVMDRDLEFVFSPKKLTIKEHGAVVEEAIRL